MFNLGTFFYGDRYQANNFCKATAGDLVCDLVCKTAKICRPLAPFSHEPMSTRGCGVKSRRTYLPSLSACGQLGNQSS